MSANELTVKAEQLERILHRCSSFLLHHKSERPVTLHQHKDVSTLQDRVKEFELKLFSMRQYTIQLEKEVQQLKGFHIGSDDVIAKITPNDNQHDIILDSGETVLLFVFQFLSLPDLCRVQRVCRTWKKVSHHPLLWKRLVMIDMPISKQVLSHLSFNCVKTETICLQGLMPAPSQTHEDLQTYISHQKAGLEPGLNEVLSQCGRNLKYLTISECSLLITERCLWLIGIYCSNLQKLLYHSNEFPPTPESIWSLANGCTQLKELHLIPSDDPEIMTRFNDKCLVNIARGFPLLTSLTIGGTSITMQGLVNIATSVKNLHYLSVIKGPPLTITTVDLLVPPAFSSLTTLSLTHTRMSPQAVVKFIDTHHNLFKLQMIVCISDYYQGPDISTTQISKYERIIDNLKVIMKHSSYSDIFNLKEE